MKREIKFRAWNGLDSRAESRMILQPNFSFDFRVIMPDGNEWDLLIMQYTGLKDKNGKEIYEGDIVSTPNGNRIVEYLAPEFSLCKTEHYKTKEQGRYGSYVIDSDTFSTPMAFEEVIGNIYENPELLK